MKELSIKNTSSVSGGYIDPENWQVIKDVAIDAAIGAALSPGNPLLGGALGLVGSVVHGAINHGPVNVTLPQLPMGPSWVH